MLPDDAARLVDRVRSGDPAGMEQLYAALVKGVRFHLWRQLGAQDVDDRVHEVYLIVSRAIMRGDVREPGRLWGFVKVVVHRQAVEHITSTARARQRSVSVDHLRDRAADPEHEARDHELLGMVHRALAGMKPQDREIITRSYLQEQPKARIRSEMGMTEIRYRNRKHCALDILRLRVRRAARAPA